VQLPINWCGLPTAVMVPVHVPLKSLALLTGEKRLNAHNQKYFFEIRFVMVFIGRLPCFIIFQYEAVDN